MYAEAPLCDSKSRADAAVFTANGNAELLEFNSAIGTEAGKAFRNQLIPIFDAKEYGASMEVGFGVINKKLAVCRDIVRLYGGQNRSKQVDISM